MSEGCTLDYASAGGNRHPAAADWDQSGTGILAYGAGSNIALWQPNSPSSQGIYHVLTGHDDVVNAVRFLPSASASEPPLLVSASADKTIRFWILDQGREGRSFPSSIAQYGHDASINCLAVLPEAQIVASGSADGVIRIWSAPTGLTENGSSDEQHMLGEIKLKPKYIPLALALSPLPNHPGATVLAVAGTRTPIEIYISQAPGSAFELKASLTGHEGWIRSLSFVLEGDVEGSDLLLASASQDRYIRLWRIHQGSELPTMKAPEDPALGILNKSLSNKAHRFDLEGKTYTLTFEALLLGHEDWIYTAAWQRWEGKLQLLTSSADNSLAIWEVESGSGIWVCNTRLGEISGQKGATTATGSTGGLWIGLWSPDAKSVACLGRTGGWRIWQREGDFDRWTQLPAVTGHVKEVKSVAWSPNGDYLLSTSSDQTTRLHAEWRREGTVTWHEFARPQIHGYDLSCLDMISNTQFISGADEKLLRVFDEPFATATLLERLGGIKQGGKESLPEAANIPVLGLSNKAIEATADGEPSVDGLSEALASASLSNGSDLSQGVAHPPTEDTLCRHTLWPEHEKLYGHGYEISCCGTTHVSNPALIATACKASSIDHAVIRVYSTDGWVEMKPALKAHSLTVTSLEFSSDDRYLLSVGRDRQWCIWRRTSVDENSEAQFVLHAQNPKGHSRMILDCSWASQISSTSGRSSTYIFATAGRDKSVKIWRMGESAQVECIDTIQATTPVTACSFDTGPISGHHLLAYGQEDGFIAIIVFEVGSMKRVSAMNVPRHLLPSATVNQLVWRPVRTAEGMEPDDAVQLAVASDDGAVRIYGVEKNSLLPRMTTSE